MKSVKRVYCSSADVYMDALQWTGQNLDEIVEFIGHGDIENGYLIILSVGGVKRMQAGDWIIKSAEGDIAPCAQAWYYTLFTEI